MKMSVNESSLFVLKKSAVNAQVELRFVGAVGSGLFIVREREKKRPCGIVAILNSNSSSHFFSKGCRG